MCSWIGCRWLQVDVPPEEVERKGRLMPGNIFLVDFEKHAVVTDEDMKRAVSTKLPYGEWLATQTVTLQVEDALYAPSAHQLCMPAGCSLCCFIARLDYHMCLLRSLWFTDIRVWISTPVALTCESTN